jgi:hypothetical protein
MPIQIQAMPSMIPIEHNHNDVKIILSWPQGPLVSSPLRRLETTGREIESRHGMEY